jgi:hypothetical protein
VQSVAFPDPSMKGSALPKAKLSLDLFLPEYK